MRRRKPDLDPVCPYCEHDRCVATNWQHYLWYCFECGAYGELDEEERLVVVGVGG